MEQTIQKKSELAEWQNQVLNEYSKLKSSTHLTSSDKKIIESLVSGATIGVLFRANPEALKVKFKELIATIGVIAGIKEDPDQLTISLLWEYITQYAIGFTLSDVRTAAMMNVAGEFEPKVEHYGLLDVNFLSGLMESFLTKKTYVRKHLQALLPPPKPEVIETNEQVFQGLIEYRKKHGHLPQFWGWQKAYDHMKEMGMIKETDDERWDLYNAEMERLTESLETETFAIGLTETSRRRADLPTVAKQNCVRNLVQKHLPK